MKAKLWWILSTCIFIAVVSIFSKNTPSPSDEEGAKLAKVYCSSCHQYPDPMLLPRDIWVNKILPEMGLRLGIGDKNTLLSRMSFRLHDQLSILGIYPTQKGISEKDWLSIVHFYETNAPEIALKNKNVKSIHTIETMFKQVSILADMGQNAQTTMVRFMPLKKEIWLGNSLNMIEKYTLNGVRKSTFQTPSLVVDIINDNYPIYLGIGNILPNEDRNGSVFHMSDKGNNGKMILDSLHRPVQMLRSDLDGDGIEDLVILEFGFETGQVRLINGKNGVESIISKQAGARNINIRDIDQDGLPDLVILFTQAREQVSLFHNLGGNKFKEEVLLRFPSVYGSSYLEIADMDNDGREDFILSFGDNADYSNSLKAFHGVQIYLNDGKGKYKKSWFYPTYGVTKTIAGDFDNDGDKDLAMIAFFSETEQQGSFLYFENQQGMLFDVYNLNLPRGKWLVMESSDMDQDGDLDLVLGNFQFGKGDSTSNLKQSIQALVLKNLLY